MTIRNNLVCNNLICLVWGAVATALGLTFVLSSCQKERFTDDPGDRLAYSTDTLRFDTVFTQLGSATIRTTAACVSVALPWRGPEKPGLS